MDNVELVAEDVINSDGLVFDLFNLSLLQITDLQTLPSASSVYILYSSSIFVWENDFFISEWVSFLEKKGKDGFP